MKPATKNIKRLALWIGVMVAGMSIWYLGGVYRVAPWRAYRNYAVDLDNLRHENEQLRKDVVLLKNQYLYLRKRLDTYAPHDLRYRELQNDDIGIESMPLLDVPPGLSAEGRLVQHIYHRLVLEKQRWDRLLQEQYKSILETAAEPGYIEYPSLKYADNAEYFDALTASLELHRRLIRDVRTFHSELQFQKKHAAGDFDYKAYDYKLRLDPFARESSIADAMQQALSALSTGVYHQEAVEVLDRLGDEFTRPVRLEYERLLSKDAESAASNYNFNIFMTFGKKIMDYADMLADQSSIPLAPKTLSELDYLQRRLQQSFRDLYEIGQQETIDAALLDMEALEHSIQ